MRSKLLASSPTMEGIKKLICDYYYGSPKTLEASANQENLWYVIGTKGVLQGVFVCQKKGRYRFCMRGE